MIILDEKGLSGLVKRMLDLLFIGGIGIFLSLPWSVKWYMSQLYEETSRNYWFLLIFLYVTGFFALQIVYEIRRIFKTLNRRNPFMMDNVNSLKRIAIASFLISIAYLVKVVCFNSFLTIVLAMVFIITGFFSIILSEVFHQAVMVKEENDLTI
ncbi:DUF2975 domain-containing protein [Sporolactobacillus laevolacticus]|uniref:DUF2975 domain-containing protein n=1 Tax=Sporolactobacillus laevolacticus DSM 442 TaxID=1395513 RepID=V6J0Z5_9BACL|nr:DUF2975 domain-containing protein [Sporolactobacillus laevolacticus]EST13485.1 hypothetical protein P343_01595 [Sporolactobacillus laevolacticus DSM 442]